jgi:CRP/FNR family transcriptional regulator
MLVGVSVGSESSASAISNDAQSANAVWPVSIKELAQNEILFQVDDPRYFLYRIETGSICIYEQRLDRGHAVIDFAFPGDLVGLGFMKSQTCTARAMVETQVACLPFASMDLLVAGDAKAEAKLAQAFERELELRRSSLVEAGRRNPIERVSALLVALSQINRHEGRDPNVIDTSWQCGAVADQLGLAIDKLAQILLDLQVLGLIEACPAQGYTQGLRIKDLDKLAEGVDRGRTSVIVDGNAFNEVTPAPLLSSNQDPAQAISCAA